MTNDELLFNKRNWSSVETGQIQALINAVNQINEDQLLNASTDLLCDDLAKQFSIDVPHLAENRTVDRKEIKIDISRDPLKIIHDRSKPFLVTGTEISLTIPFEGEAEAFTICPTQFTYNPPRATIRGNNLIISIQGDNLTTEVVQSHLNRTEAQIESYLANLRNDVAQLERNLRYQARAAIDNRKQKLLASRSLVASLGYKIKERTDTPTYPAPNVRRKIKPAIQLPSGATYKPEPVLENVDYEHILTVIQNMAIVMERSPSAFSSIDEEALRWHFIMQLNGHYEGETTGETFNHEGKTDILIRHQGKNIFIAECKFWGGPKIMTETIDQLLGYTSWRDTKTAIIIFCKNKDFTRVIQSIHDTVKQHPNFRRHERQVSETAHRYVFSQKEDIHREMILTTLAFHIPS